jgi:sigma-54 dependent transcriptional regulator, acetoin dehydrogenase operon transcriptional activator AcoR
MAPDSTERSDNAWRTPGGTALHPVLYLVLECGRPMAGGMRIALAHIDEVVIGRGDARRLTRTRAGDKTTLRVEVADKRLSTEHARLALGDGKVTLEDLGSTNGTRVDGALVTAIALRSDTVFELGQCLFLYAEVAEKPTWRTTDLDAEQASETHAGFLTLEPLYGSRLERLKRVAATDASILLLGETGTGKEVLARAIHEASPRPGPFVAINCGAIPASLVESTLFGHVKGAFSGAGRDETGLVRSAQFGTLFLDEIGDLPPSSQAALLRVLQEGEVLPVGATRPVTVDVRIVSATHRPLPELMDRGEFRRDLYGRLAAYAHPLPALKDRRADLGLLIATILRAGKNAGGAALRFRTDAANVMLRYDWPLNVRELAQCLATSSALAHEGLVTPEDLGAAVMEGGEAAGELAADDGPSSDRDEAVRRELLLRLADTNGNLSEVARAMGKARQQVQRWVKRFGLDPDAFRKRE